MRQGFALQFVALAAFSFAGSASAHVRLLEPTPRYPAPPNEDGSDLKDGPCGRAGDTRTTDPDRITTFAPGQIITLSWSETIDHGGHYRVAFDDAGQDAFVNPTGFDDIVDPPVLPVLLDGIADKNGGMYEAEVTLPTIECETCTLQLIQVMDDGGPFDEGAMYYQCADIRLVGTPPDGGTDSGTDGDIPDGDSDSGTGATGGGGGTGGTGGSAGVSGTGGAGAAGTGGTAGSSGSGGGTGGSSGASGGSTGGSGATGGAGGGSTGGSAGSWGGIGGSAAGTGGTAPTTPDVTTDASCSLGASARLHHDGVVVGLLGLLLAVGCARRPRP